MDEYGHILERLRLASDVPADEFVPAKEVLVNLRAAEQVRALQAGSCRALCKGCCWLLSCLCAAGTAATVVFWASLWQNERLSADLQAAL